MCMADGGSMSTCSGGCSGSGGICQKSAGAQLYEKHVNFTTRQPEAGATTDEPAPEVECSACNTQWLCNTSDCSYGYSLLAGNCYAATVQINARNDQSIRITQGSSCYIQSCTDANCQNIDFGPPDGDISCSCCTCYGINPLMNFKIDGQQIIAHGWAGPPASGLTAPRVTTASTIVLGDPTWNKDVVKSNRDHM